MTSIISDADSLDFSRYKLGWSDEDKHIFKAKKGLNEAVVREMSEIKGEETWMLNFRLRALKRFEQKPMAPWFAVRMPDLDFQDIYYYLKSTEGQVDSWEDLPPEIKRTYDRLGIPEAERNFLAGVTAQYESEVVFHRNRADLESLGVLFCDMDTAVRDYPEIVQKYFGTVIPPNDNKFAALNSAVWSGGSFIYVPPGVTVDQPLQAYFRINAENMGQFERTLIIADEGSSVRYLEGCSSPRYTSNSLHSAVVEIIALPGAKVAYSTVQSWDASVMNLVTKRARAEESARVEWVDGNSGCLAEGSRIATPEGLCAIELLEVGDKVQSLKESTGELVFRSVLAKRYSGEQPVREVRLGGNVLLATDNHPFYTLDGAGTGRYVRVDALTEVALLDVNSAVTTAAVTVGEDYVTRATWDIEVEGTGNFVAEGFIVHNSKLTMKYPSVYLMGPKASGEVLSVAYAGAGQVQDTGAKMIHVGRETTSLITAKSVSKDGGDTIYRGLVRVEEGAKGAKSFVRCDALILDEQSTSETKPTIEVGEQDASIGHEATVAKIGDNQLFYLQSRGLTEAQAMSMIVNGFMEPVVRALPMEYAVEWNRLIDIQMEDSIG